MWFTKKEKAAPFVPALPAVLSVLLKAQKHIKRPFHPPRATLDILSLYVFLFCNSVVYIGFFCLSKYVLKEPYFIKAPSSSCAECSLYRGDGRVLMLQSYLGLRDRNMPKWQLLIDRVHSTINLEEGKQFGNKYKLWAQEWVQNWRDSQLSGHAAGQSP